jgi:ParB-like chromosome segregation protein Spo0J
MHIYIRKPIKKEDNMDIQYLLSETLKPYDKVEIPISQEDYDRLKLDIQEHGIKTPLHIKGHTVLSGANRLRIAQELGIKFVPCIVLPDDMTELEMKEYAILDNLARRHLSVEQKAALALEIEKIEQVKARKRQISELKQNQIENDKNLSDRSNLDLTVKDDVNEDTGKALELAAQKAGISYDTAFKAKTLATKAPEAWQEVQAGKKTIHRAYTDYRQQNMGLRTPEAQCMVDIQDLAKHMNRIYDLKLAEIQTTTERILKNYQYLSEEDKKQLLEIFASFNQVIKAMETLVELQKKILVEYAE